MPRIRLFLAMSAILVPAAFSIPASFADSPPAPSVSNESERENALFAKTLSKDFDGDGLNVFQWKFSETGVLDINISWREGKPSASCSLKPSSSSCRFYWNVNISELTDSPFFTIGQYQEPGKTLFMHQKHLAWKRSSDKKMFDRLELNHPFAHASFFNEDGGRVRLVSGRLDINKFPPCPRKDARDSFRHPEGRSLQEMTSTSPDGTWKARVRNMENGWLRVDFERDGVLHDVFSSDGTVLLATSFNADGKTPLFSLRKDCGSESCEAAYWNVSKGGDSGETADVMFALDQSKKPLKAWILP